MRHLAISIVVYNSPLDVLEQTIKHAFAAVQKLKHGGFIERVSLEVVDNASGPDYLMALKSLLAKYQNADQWTVNLKAQTENQGYGRGHNSIESSSANFQLILNPDVFLAPDSLCHALHFMRENPKVGVAVPRVVDLEGKVAYLCKRYPSVLDLALRGFAPDWLQKIFRQRLDHYEMRDLDWTRPHDQVELASGCCLLMRGEVWKALKGFSPDYFMYFEDFDLSMRTREFSTIAYVPGFEVTHLGGNTARKGWRHIVWFMQSARVFFDKYGWRFW